MRRKNTFLLVVLCISFMQLFAQKQDTLYAKRVFLSTHIYDDSVKLSNRKAAELFKDTWAPKIKYKWSRVLKPVGAFVAMSGVGLTSYAIKGTSLITTVEGKRVNYKVISLPQLSVGVGMFVIGCSIIASSNQLARHSVEIYNSMLKASQKTNAIHKVQFGLTESNAIGFSVLLK